MKPKDHRDLLGVDSKPNASYEHLSLAHLSAYSVHWLTQWEIPTTYENISVLNARLFPVRFSLAGFPEMPDAMATNRTILQMRPKYRGLATSDARKGVFLTENRCGHSPAYRAQGLHRRATGARVERVRTVRRAFRPCTGLFRPCAAFFRPWSGAPRPCAAPFHPRKASLRPCGAMLRGRGALLQPDGAMFFGRSQTTLGHVPCAIPAQAT